MSKIYYALGLHMHQPPDNLKLLIESNEWEAQQIIKCYERAASYAHLYRDVACFHVGFSGILLRQFKDKDIIDRYRKFVDIPKMLDSYRKAKNIEIIGMGFYHPIFPLIPKEDWEEQLIRGRAIVEEIFGQKPKGFWPSEMAFCMEMIPTLKKVGYEYVVIDHVHMFKPQGGNIDCFKPYRISYGKNEMVVIPRNRDLSNAQESGLDPHWFVNEVNHKMANYPSQEKARLVTTWSDGENGGWFRQMDEGSGFFGHFFAPLMEMVRNAHTEITPIKISDFLKKFPPQEDINVRTGAWNVGSTSGFDFSQWNGLESQKKAINELFKTSKLYWDMKKKKLSKPEEAKLRQARELILDAETSCYLFWGEAWLPKIYDKLNSAKELLK
ncbi:MAG: glycoside hydrolase family 57 [Candidatus Omnitrophica bacterium]|nr:glycoside hydrolase family 57 [Candidatus Omnitrophota bacterium]